MKHSDPSPYKALNRHENIRVRIVVIVVIQIRTMTITDIGTAAHQLAALSTCFFPGFSTRSRPLELWNLGVEVVSDKGSKRGIPIAIMFIGHRIIIV